MIDKWVPLPKDIEGFLDSETRYIISYVRQANYSDEGLHDRLRPLLEACWRSGVGHLLSESIERSIPTYETSRWQRLRESSEE